MRKNYSVVPVKIDENEKLPSNGANEPPISPANSNHDLDLVKIASKWKRRDQGLPSWWRNHLMGMFR